ncbi:hypothetical protein F7P69_20475 [Cellulosimicrobium funkei]|nr:hypothetical protein [Cellulosimicrobium funkei]
MSTRPRLSPASAGHAPGHVPVRGAARLLRGWAAALVATVLAAGSHTVANLVESGASHAAHDAGPAPILWILTLALAGPVCTALAGRRLSWWRLSAGVAASQALFHWLYSATASAAPAAAPVLTGSHGGHGQHGGHPEGLAAITTATATATVPGTGEVPGAGAALHADSPAMVAAHLLAAVVTVLALRRGEVLAAHVAELAVGLILRSPGARLARWVPAVPVRRVSAARLNLVHRPEDVLCPSLRLRGPPEGSLLALAA